MHRGSKLFLLLISCLIVSPLLLHPLSLPKNEGPRIKFKEDSWDFGSVKEGTVLNHVFIFENIGDSPLQIEKVRTSCGCAAALVSNKKLNPGEKGEIKVTFNTRGYEGNQSKYIYVESNDSRPPRKQLTVSASINVPPRPKIEVDRFSLDGGILLEGEPISAEFKVRNSGEKVLEVELSHKGAEFLTGNVKVTSLRIPAKKEISLTVQIPPRNNPGMIREYILLKSNDPIRRNLSVYISGYVVTRKQLKELFEKYKSLLDIK
ncbi:MAG: DUF1573 domain-containing protein [Acidobacteriota bacterium]